MKKLIAGLLFMVGFLLMQSNGEFFPIANLGGILILLILIVILWDDIADDNQIQ